MHSGQVQTLFIHGANPVFELPPSLGFAQALSNVKQVISFASFPDETAMQSDYVLPDHTPLESWGYQRTLAGSDRPVISGLQPVVVPLYDTRASADVLLSAGKLPYSDEVDFIQKKIRPLLNQTGGTLDATEIATFWAQLPAVRRLVDDASQTCEPAGDCPAGPGKPPPSRSRRPRMGSSTW